MSLLEPIQVQEWEEWDNHSSPTGVHLSTGHLFTPYHMDSILTDPTEYAQRTTTHPWGVMDTAELFFTYLTGAVASETQHIIQRAGVYRSYAQRLFSRLDKGVDTGIAHEDSLSIWGSLPKDQRDYVETLVLRAAENMEDFPMIGNMNVILTNTPVSVDIAPTIPTMNAPIVVETKKGIAMIVPTLVGLAGSSTRANAAALSHVMGRVGNMEINQFHMWDVSTMSIKAVPKKDCDAAISMIAGLCSAS